MPAPDLSFPMSVDFYTFRCQNCPAMKNIPRFPVAILAVLLAFQVAGAQDKKALTFTDIMKFRQVKSPSISRDGEWIVHTAKPDRGDPEVSVYSANGKKTYKILRGEKPVISNDGKWVAAVHTVPAEELVKKKPAKGGKKPEGGLILMNTTTGEQRVFDRVQSFRFSEDSKWLLYHNFREEEEEQDSTNVKEEHGESKADFIYSGSQRNREGAGNRAQDAEEDTGKENSGSKNAGSMLNLWSLEDGAAISSFSFVKKYAVDSLSRYLAFTVGDSNAMGNGMFLADLEEPGRDPVALYADSSAWADNLSWNNRNGGLAFLAGITGEKEKRKDAALYMWSPGDEAAKCVLDDGDLPVDWKLYHKNRLRWTKDGKRLFLGIKPVSEITEPEEEESIYLVSKVFDTEAILEDRTVDVWHWNDPYINSNQKKRWEREKDRTYTGVYYPETDRFVQLADEEMPNLRISENASTLLGSSNVPYAKRMTWEGMIRDYYLVDVKTGRRQVLVDEQYHTVNLSPDGRYAVYFKAGDWHMAETSGLKSRNLTGSLDVTFADEDWDYPADVEDYGVGDWLDGSEAVLIYDKYDIWQFPTNGDAPVCLTEGMGRKGKYQFRIKRLDTEKEYLQTGEPVFVTAYHDLEKFTAVYSIKAGIRGITKVVEEPKKYTLLAKAKDADRILLTRESYTEFPDLWVTDMSFRKPRRLSDVNPQIEEFAWGEAELVGWTSSNGIPIQGILIKPGNYKPGNKYPVLVYYYRFFTDRLYEFNEVVINHRPCFPFYASNGYAVFLPDIRFDIGNPGYSATKCLVPGVQKIIDMGVADPEAVCLHGHSWSGYQTAFVITQTDIFACAIAGAPVSNMTSAYSGIRWETGLARQFQYEKSQSRIGASLWEARDKYIENSPVFFADRINTPLLIQFGDVDGAVPWYQGIELYLAMRRLEKDCVFLQYRNEPHHLKQYANKLDYTLKFKAYLDHYLKGEPAEDWIRNGVPYKGE